MWGREVRILMWKEWRQLLRSRGALLSALFFPLLFLVIIPGIQIVAIATGAGTGTGSGVNVPPGTPLPPALANIEDDPAALLRVLMLPLFMALTGLTLPSVTAIYTLIAERENRTLELLVGLPVRVGQIILAKLLVILILSAGVSLALFAVDAVLILILDIASVGYIVALLLVLLCALAYSATSALLIALLARDFRTANNLTGAAVGPLILISVGLLMFMPSATVGVVVLAALYALAAVVAALVALRVVTFERLLR